MGQKKLPMLKKLTTVEERIVKLLVNLRERIILVNLYVILVFVKVQCGIFFNDILFEFDGFMMSPGRLGPYYTNFRTCRSYINCLVTMVTDLGKNSLQINICYINVYILI